MTKVLFIHHYPKPHIIELLRTQLQARGTTTEVQTPIEFKNALREQFDEIAICIDSMKTLEWVSNIIKEHNHTKNALVSIWKVSTTTFRGGVSIAYNPLDITKQLTDMAKTKKEAQKKN